MPTAAVKQLAEKFYPKVLAARRHIHQHPELSYKEHDTAAFVRQQLLDGGITHINSIADTGLLAIIEGKDPQSRIVALRADMDALPIEEENAVPYKSKVPGVMHACGHDVHTACLIGAAHILHETRSEWNGTVKLLFQPGEEKNPGGATLMIRDGALRDPAPTRIFGMHVNPALPVGKFSFRGGMAMASADEIYITINATGGHAASPDLTADPILIGSLIVSGLQQIISRNNHAQNPSVLSITAFNGGNATNVIPSEVKLMGTLRAMNEEWRFKAHTLIKKYVEDVAAAYGASAKVTIDVGYPFLLNNEELTRSARKLAEDLVGAAQISETEMRMGAEDFAYYSQIMPACFFRLGTRNEAKGITANVHTPKFNIDEEALLHGMAMMAWLGMKG